jgi:hypothetical protein
MQFLELGRDRYLLAEPAVYKVLYVVALALAFCALQRGVRPLVRASLLAICLTLVVVLQRRQFGLSIYIAQWRLVYAAVTVGLLLLAWRLLRYFGSYYKDLWSRYFPKA